MRKRYYLYKRGCNFYAEDSETRNRTSLNTRDKRHAEKLLHAKNECSEQPVMKLAIAKVYLAACDPKLLERTWAMVMEEFCNRGKESTRKRQRRAVENRAFDLIRNRKLVESTGDHLRAVMKSGGVFVNHFLRCLHNLAIGLGWLPCALIPPKLWPRPESRPKRAITWEEHQRIIQAEKNSERRLYYELLWETGASQTDAALLKADNIDLENNVLIYQRRKTSSTACMTIGACFQELLNQLPTQGSLFPQISRTLDKDRAAEFRRRCRLLKIEGISLHSYRYAWAERANRAGYPERFAQEALGHNSTAVHRAYSRRAQVIVPALEDYEKAASANKVIPMRSRREELIGSEAGRKTKS